MPIDLYYSKTSIPCNAILLLARALNVELNLKHIDKTRFVLLEPEFEKLQLLSRVPLIVENGSVVDPKSKSLLIWLIVKFAPNDPLYPERRLQKSMYDFVILGTKMPRQFLKYYFSLNDKPDRSETYADIVRGFEELDEYLVNNTWLLGKQITIADLSIVAALSAYKIAGEFDFGPYRNVQRFYQTCSDTIDGFTEMEMNFDLLKQQIDEQRMKTNV